MTNKHQQDPQNKWQEIDEQPVEHDMDETSLEEATEAAEGIEFPSHQQLEDQLTAAEQKVAAYKEKMMLAHAELDNVRKRAERDVQNAHKFGTEKLLSDMLPVIDSLTRAIEGPEPQSQEAQNMREGIVLTLDILEKSLGKYGVEVINPEPGDAFNPEQQEAMSMQPGTGLGANCVVQVLQKGYSLNGRVLRAAMVIVSQ